MKNINFILLLMMRRGARGLSWVLRGIVRKKREILLVHWYIGSFRWYGNETTRNDVLFVYLKSY